MSEGWERAKYLMADRVTYQVDVTVWHQAQFWVHSRVWDQVREWVRQRVRDQVRERVRDHVDDSHDY
jgi:hypothetical protein